MRGRYAGRHVPAARARRRREPEAELAAASAAPATGDEPRATDPSGGAGPRRRDHRALSQRDHRPSPQGVPSDLGPDGQERRLPARRQ